MIDWAEFARRLADDGEFRVAARLWDAELRLDVGDASQRVRIEQGRIAGVAPCAADAPCDVFVSAPAETWQRMLEPAPRPHYHDLLAAQLHHGLRMNEDLLDYAPYYGALRRLVELLREARAVS